MRSGLGRRNSSATRAPSCSKLLRGSAGDWLKGAPVWLKVRMLLCLALCGRRVVEARVPRPAGQREQVEALVRQRPVNDTSAGRGPRAALKCVGLRDMSNDGKAAWLEESRLDAILGNCRLSIPSVLSGVRCYIAFAGLFSCLCLVSCCHRACAGRCGKTWV